MSSVVNDSQVSSIECWRHFEFAMSFGELYMYLAGCCVLKWTGTFTSEMSKITSMCSTDLLYENDFMK